MSYLLYLREFRNNKQSVNFRYLNRIRMWYYRQNKTICRIERPTFLDKARSLGYKNKHGVYVYRVRVKRGGRPRRAKNNITHGKPSKSAIYQRKPTKNLQSFAEIRLGRKVSNLSVINSYWVGQDRVFKYYEAICYNPRHTRVKSDSSLNWICGKNNKHRECRGLTAASKRSRGLGKGVRYNQTIGGSRHAAYKRRNTISLKRYR